MVFWKLQEKIGPRTVKEVTEDSKMISECRPKTFIK